jgi:hypothetical protein
VTTIVATPTPTSGPAVPTLPIITCSLTIDYPHESSHVPATVNVVAHWSCTSAVASLSMSVQLFYAGLQIGSGRASNTGQASLNGNAAATGCISGYYSGAVVGSVVFPPGYSGSGSRSNSSEAYVTCT